ncbi:MAG TPA: cytochrome d ubiquinol oxidase subunit II [Methylomirabilota bacterium]
MLNSVWFVVLAFMLAGYAVLDGFDLGVGTLHLALGRNTRERDRLIDAIGPVWNGNEVWLLAAGGSMVAAFPHVYASSFSGFYLALMLVLWLLVLRGLGIEFRHQVHHDLWKHAWDVTFSVASALLALLFGVALGNVLRGVPLDASGEFTGTFALLLNPFALLGGLLSVAVLSMHGAAWIALKTDGGLQARARRWAAGLWWGAMALLALMVGASFLVRPDFTRNFAAQPWLLALPAVTLAAAGAIKRYQRRHDDVRAFLAGATFIAGVLASVAAGLYPRLLPSLPGSPHPGLDIYNAASPENSLRIALWVYLFGMVLVGIYLVNIYRVWRGKVVETYH